jgi:hypothetical protein
VRPAAPAGIGGNHEQASQWSGRCVLAMLLALTVAGCASKERLTAKATGCGIMDVSIVDSEFKRAGNTTAWCAKCGGKRYQCVSNASRDRVQCFEAREGTSCY